MHNIKISRVYHRPDGMFGVLAIDYLPICVTLERPWKDNARSISCIPAGAYLAKRVLSPKFGNTFEITDVAGRSHILFHKGNIIDDTHGCVILGEYFNAWMNSDTCSVASSGDAFKEFMYRLKDVDSFTVNIVNSY